MYTCTHGRRRRHSRCFINIFSWPKKSNVSNRAIGRHHNALKRIGAYLMVGKRLLLKWPKANGIHLLEARTANPLLTTTLGTGQMIRHALDAGVQNYFGTWSGVTNDAGSGMAQSAWNKGFRCTKGWKCPLVVAIYRY